MIFRYLSSFLAIVMVALCATAAQAATTDIQLNLRYDDPADEAAGGSWDLLVQNDGTNGMAGLRVVIDGISDVTGVDTPLSAIIPNGDAFDNISNVFRFQPFGGGSAVEIVAGDNLEVGLVLGVGTGSGASNVASDDLYPGNSPVWDNSALIASGTFGATRPVFLEVDVDGNLSPGSGVFAGANEFAAIATDPVLASIIGDVSVRGDGVASDTLLSGDADRSGNVDIADFNLLAFGFNGPGTWDTGDFNSSGTKTIADFNELAFNFNGFSVAPALAAAAVPEPGTLALAGIALVAMLRLRRRES